jgi:membrane protein
MEPGHILARRGVAGWTVRMGAILVLAGGRFLHDLCLQRAAGLAFSTILSLIPLAVLFFSFAGLLGGGQRIIDYVKDKVFPLVAPDFQVQLSEWLDHYISPTAFREGPTGIVNISALLGLLLTAFGMMVIAERYINIIWNVSVRRTWLQKFTTFWVILTVSPFFLAMSMVVGEFLVPEGGLVDRLQREYWFVRSVYQFFVPLMIGFAGFSTLYLFLPATRVRTVSAALGGVVASTLWETGRHAFFFYIHRQSTITSFYPKLAAIPLFLVWVYVNWLVVLLGAEMAYVHQNLRSLLDRRGKDALPGRHSRAALALRLLRNIHEAFKEGRRPPHVDRLSADLVIRSDTLKEVANLLVENGYLVEDARVPGSFHLAKDPAYVKLSEVVALVLKAEWPSERISIGSPEPQAATSAERPIDLEMAQAWRAALDSFGDRTLAGL